MKKLISLLAVVALFMTTAVSAFASFDYNGYQVPERVYYKEYGAPSGVYFTLKEYLEADDTLFGNGKLKNGWSNAYLTTSSGGGLMLVTVIGDHYVDSSGNAVMSGTGYKWNHLYNEDVDAWEFTSEQNFSSGNVVLTKGVIDDSIVFMNDVKDTSGNVVRAGDRNFMEPPVPLAEAIQAVTGETLQQVTAPALGGVMKTLVPCGVGLTACLVVLSLFGKRSLIFRS